MNSSTLLQKLWNYSNGPRLGRSLARSRAREHAGAREKPRLTLRHDGMSNGDYPSTLLRAGYERPTCLLFSSGARASRPLCGHEPALKRARACYLKKTDERSCPPYNQPSPLTSTASLNLGRAEVSLRPNNLARVVPLQYAWTALPAKDGEEVVDHYRHALEALGNEKSTLALIFDKAQKKPEHPTRPD